ncbi:MAG: nucleoside deaminase [Gammaproteobacteria bacterium]|nr:nucleoside deaminase [Gammaproteobacteria bacterium]
MRHKDREFLSQAVELAREKSKLGNCGPFGAVIVHQGKVIAEGWNQVVLEGDPTAHAEVVAIRHACEKLGTHILAGCELFSSCEPCPMCFSAAVWARLDRVVFAETRHGAAKAGFDDSLLYEAVKSLDTQSLIQCEHQPLAAASEVFLEWEANPDKKRY